MCFVIVEDVSEDDIKKILEEFCNSYNKKTFQAIPRLTKLTDKKFAVTFPYDINFEIYCYFINYVNYPMGLTDTLRLLAGQRQNHRTLGLQKKVETKM